jgi:hypothetical protein
LDFEINSVKSFTRDHVNYHSSMTTHGLTGIWNLDEDAPLYDSETRDIEGFLTLRVVLYKKMKMSDGHQLIAELHQLMPMSHVEVVHPNCEEGEMILLNMEKNVVAYLQHYLVEEGMDKEFVHDLLKKSCDPSLFHTADQCEWDAKTRQLLMPEEKAKEGEKDMKKAEWYKNDFDDFLSSVGKRDKKGGKKQYADPENIYKLDDERSVDTVHVKPGSKEKKGYGGSPGAPAFQVGGKKGQDGEADVETVEIDSDDEVEGDATATASTNYTGLSRAELLKTIERLEKANLSSKPMGSAPNSGNRSHSTASDEEESMSVDGSSSESSSDPSGGSSDEVLDGTPS